MIDTIYIEKEIQNDPKTLSVLAKFKNNPKKIIIDRFSEIFNLKNQNFRLQKIKPALIIAKKYGKTVQNVPSICSCEKNNYYFSTLLNCPFDCKYCFLQGFFRSAFYVFFINSEAFKEEIKTIKTNSLIYSGYDSDSLALDHITSFTKDFVPFFETLPHLTLELRTKSVNIKNLLDLKPTANTVVSFSLNPNDVINKIEKNTPPLGKRLQAAFELQNRGWQIGLHFDPVIFTENFEETYSTFFKTVFTTVDPKKIKFATLGTLRFPKTCFKNIQKINKTNDLLSTLFENSSGFFSYMPDKKQKKILNFCENGLTKYLDKNKLQISVSP